VSLGLSTPQPSPLCVLAHLEAIGLGLPLHSEACALHGAAGDTFGVTRAHDPKVPFSPRVVQILDPRQPFDLCHHLGSRVRVLVHHHLYNEVLHEGEGLAEVGEVADHLELAVHQRRLQTKALSHNTRQSTRTHAG
jgi:hypothetical protein